MLDYIDFTQSDLKRKIKNAIKDKKINYNEYRKMEKELKEGSKINKRLLRRISIFRMFLDYKISDLYVTDEYGQCEILVKIGKTFDTVGIYYKYKKSYFMSLKNGKIREYFISNNYDQYFVEPLSKYIFCDKNSFTFKEAMIYFEEKVLIPLLLRRINASSRSSELKFNLDNLIREINNIKYSKDSKIKNKEQIEYCACCKLIKLSKYIFNYYYKIINRKENEVIHLEYACYYLEDCIREIKAVISNFETLKKLIAEYDELLKEKLILLGHNDFIKYLDLIKIISANIQYIEEFGKPKEELDDEDIAILKKSL